MVGRVYKARACVRYGKGFHTNFPVLKLKLFNVLGEEFPEEVEFPVDTGFAGSLMLEMEDYKFFMVGELPRKYWRRYSTLTGTIIMRVAKAIVLVNGIKFEALSLIHI